MDHERFDDLLRTLASKRVTRGDAVRALAGGVAAAAFGTASGSLAAKAGNGKGRGRDGGKHRGNGKGRTPKVAGRSGTQDAQVEYVPCPTPGNDGKVLWCHATSSETNPYEQICIDQSGADDTQPESNHFAHEGDCNCADALCLCDETKKNGTCCKCNHAAVVCKKNACSGPGDTCAEVADPSQNNATCDTYAGSVSVCEKTVCQDGDCVKVGDPDKAGTNCAAEVPGGVPDCKKAACGGGAQAGQCIVSADPAKVGATCGNAPECQSRVCDANGECVRGSDDPFGTICDADGGTADDGLCCAGTCINCPEDQALRPDCTCGGGCTLTQGYWKTHSKQGPAPYDDAWKNLGPTEEKTIFFLSKKTYYEVLGTPPQGNPYYILAHQFIAATLNKLNGASSTIAVDAALAAATTFFTAAKPSDTLKAAKKNEVLGWAATLGAYNEGTIGPGHCD